MKCANKSSSSVVMKSKISLQPGYDYDQENNAEFENNRRVHLFHGMVGEEYHKVFDEMYHRRIQDKLDEKNKKEEDAHDHGHDECQDQIYHNIS